MSSSDEPQQQRPSNNNDTNRSTPLVLDTPEGLEYLATLIHHHRRDFLLANLTQQAAMIRFIREQLVATRRFADPHGDPLDDDAVALGIAKVFYLYTDEEDQLPEPQAEVAAAAASSSASSNGNNHHVHFMEQEDSRIYEYLTHLRHHTPVARISPSPTPAAGSPKLGPAAATAKPPAKRKSSTSNNVSSKATAATAATTSSDPPEKKSKRSSNNGNSNISKTQTAALETSQGREEALDADRESTDSFPTRQEISARAMQLLQETQTTVPDIPKGVTVRPSGRWQSQVYYNGASRYLGVYSNANEAALAWIIAKHILTESSQPGAPKAEKDKWYAMVRDVVTLTVQGAQTGKTLQDAWWVCPDSDHVKSLCRIC